MNPFITPAEQNALLRQDLSSFIIRAFAELNPADRYLHNWHIDLIADRLNAVRLGTCKRLIINIPPRNMKSICASVAFPTWMLGHNPSIRIICASYGQDLAAKLANDSRNLMQTAWYQAAFPNTRIAPGKAALHDFMTTQQGGRMATSVGGVITGRGADLLIIDDPMKPEEAFSDPLREKANAWFDGTAYSRLNSKKEGAIIIIMQRLHLDDLVGHVLEKEPWELLSLPAIAEEETTHTYHILGRKVTVRRAIGDPLHAERESLHILTKIRSMQGEYNFAGQYLQSPVPAGGGFIKTAWLQYLADHEFPTQYEQIIQSWDTASKTSELADYSVCTTWGIKARKYYLLHVWRKRVDFPELKRAVVEQYGSYKPSAILIEDKASGIALIQELNKADVDCIKPIKPEGNKEMRLNQQSILFENGTVNLPAKAHWLMDYVHELTSFPTTKYDDQVDSTTQALAYLRQDFPGKNVFEFYREQAEARKNRIPPNGY